MDEMMIRLQTILGYQEEEIAHLSQELYTQQKELQQLKRQMATLLDRLRCLPAAAEGMQDLGGEPPPPHY